MHQGDISGSKTWVHRLPAGIKLGGTLLLVCATAVLPREPHLAYLVPAALVLVLWAASRMSLRFAFKRLFVAELFILGIALLSLLAPEARPVVFSALMKSNLCVAFMLVLVWSTPFHQILMTLRGMRMPSIMVTTIALLYRYLPVLGEESRRMQRALASRTFQKGKRFQWRMLSVIAGQLFIRSANRAERIYMAMCARGWK